MKKLSLICLGLLISQTAHASGLYFYEIGTEDTALAGAGQAARAQDASTIVTNPACMTRLPDHMFTGGIQAMDGDISYTLDNESGRQSPGDIMSFFPNASAFYILRARPSRDCINVCGRDVAGRVALAAGHPFKRFD